MISIDNLLFLYVIPFIVSLALCQSILINIKAPDKLKMICLCVSLVPGLNIAWLFICVAWALVDTYQNLE